MKKIKRVLFYGVFVICVQSLFGGVPVTLPDDYADLASFVNQEIELRQRLYVVSNKYWVSSGELTLASEQILQPTEVEMPGSAEYRQRVDYNKACQIILLGVRGLSPSDGVVRCGSFTDRVVGKLVTTKYGYAIEPAEMPEFEYDVRPTAMIPKGDNELTLCGFNLEYYMIDQFSDKVGPLNKEEAERQHIKIIEAMTYIKADVFGLVEVQQGNEILDRLVGALNEELPGCHYSYISDGTRLNGTWTRACFVYRDDKVRPLREQQTNDTGVRYRKKAQGFEVLESGEKFVFMLGHFKAKSGKGTGDNANRYDGQGTFNGDRLREAVAMVTMAKSCSNYYSDPDVIMMGDLNAYSMEDPIRHFTDNGYSNLIKSFGGDTAYSYRYNGSVGCLDHALANESLAMQATGCTVLHINSDEPDDVGYAGRLYQPNMYRASDHDPVIVTLDLHSMPSATDDNIVADPLVYTSHGVLGVAGVAGNEIRLFTSDGRLVEVYHIDSPDFLIDTSHLAAGVYLLQVLSDNSSTVLKVVIAK